MLEGRSDYPNHRFYPGEERRWTFGWPTQEHNKYSGPCALREALMVPRPTAPASRYDRLQAPDPLPEHFLFGLHHLLFLEWGRKVRSSRKTKVLLFERRGQ